MPKNVRSIVARMRFPGRSDDVAPLSFVDCPFDGSAFGLIVTLNSSGEIAGLTVTDPRKTPSADAASDVRPLLYAVEFWLTAYLLDIQAAKRLCALSDGDFLALRAMLGDGFCPDRVEDGCDLRWFAGIIPGGHEWLREQTAFIQRVDDGIVCASDGKRSLFTEDGELTRDADTVLRAVAGRIRSGASLLGRLLQVVITDIREDNIPSSGVQLRVEGAASVAA